VRLPRTEVLFVAAIAAATVARADKLDRDSTKWLEDVAAIILPDEAKIYAQLKDRSERVEFEKIFWARRDPGPGTSLNGYRQEFLARKAQADQRFKVAGLAGSATDCGRLLILLGEPDLIERSETTAPQQGLVNSFGGEYSGATQVPQHQPEVWTYRSRPDVSFTGGEGKIVVDARCAVQPMVAASLERFAARRILNPGLTYKVSNGTITRLADLLPKPTPAQEMLKSGRQDFGIAGQVGYYRAEGPTAVIGLVETQGASLPVKDADGTKVVDVTIAAQAVTEEGQVVAFDERRVTAPVGEGGAVLAAYRLLLQPGHYTLRYGVMESKTGKGATASILADVPDLNGGDLSAGTLLIVQDIVEGSSPNPADPLDAFVLGKIRLVPRFGNTFARSEAAHFFFSVNGSVDKTTGKADLTVGLALLKGTSIVGSTPVQTFTDPHVVTSVGPVPLQFAPGHYTARLKVKDNVAQTEATVEQAFEIK
jgi:GWxTD domain-containing protein